MFSGTYPERVSDTGTVRISPARHVRNPMYGKIGVAIDNSESSAIAEELALCFARACGARLTGIHAYTGRFHRSRFEALEPHLPDQYQGEESLGHQRRVHEVLIGRGLELISSEYLKRIRQACGNAEIPFTEYIADGKNTDVLIDASTGQDLMVMGASGLGSMPGSAGLGSVTRGMLRFGRGDLLIARRGGSIRQVLACVDGSDAAYHAAARAAGLSALLGASLAIAASHDRILHRTVFGSLSSVLSEEAGRAFRFSDQEQLHTAVIDQSLSCLYTGFLERAVAIAGEHGVPARPYLLEGKPYAAVCSLAASLDADLVVVGGTGLHHGKYGRIGSNAERIAEETAAGMLVVRSPAEGTGATTSAVPEPCAPAGRETRLTWEPAARALLERIPAFARPMAVLAAERYAKTIGRDRITTEILEHAREENGS